ncbi:MAG: T9SS C-terminal target domain-containing protein [Calditrichaeota bacterium]|nr:MAG: T9SS C-terminal target domain-containing protein [Calditrichota bacterium]MBL1205239.1 T9SS C-terminal target domain-containing protein [Calditrichota bacterium]NOG45069.1 T9SS type A sorting domain-containing protein [Calditrichota bacterium]
MKRTILILTSIFFFIAAYAGDLISKNSQKKYSQVKIFFENKQQLKSLAQAGLIFDHVQVEKEKGQRFNFTTVLSSTEREILSVSGINFNIETEDVLAAFQDRQKMSILEKKNLDENDPLEGFELGSHAGFYTWEEAIAELDSMYLLYPDIITAKDSIGSSIEGRTIWMAKISDNPNDNEDEPEVLYNAMHHAREPGGMMAVIYYMHYLLENYGSDPEVTYLVDNRELYFVPIVNPDGYEYNREIAPDGGGMWRKNKRDNNNDGKFSQNEDGVDLNRNYGHEWGYDDDGSSPSPGSDTYRGTSGFSEPETQVMRDLCNAHNFKFALNYHTYSNLLIYPWGYIGSFETPDSLLFRQYSADMTQYNNYLAGTGDQTVGYLVNGDSDDWMYGEQISKNKIFSMTPEVGTGADGFWPDQSRIYPQVQENVYPNLFVAWAAGGLVRFVDYQINYSGDETFLSAGRRSELVFEIKNIGLGSAEDIKIRLVSEDSLVTIDDGVLTISNIESQDTVLSPYFGFTIDSTAPSGYVPELNVEIDQQGVKSLQPIKGIIVGKPEVIYSYNLDDPNADWSADGPWERVNDSSAPTGEFYYTDSPSGEYGDNLDISLYNDTPIDIQNVNSAYLEFWSKWDIEKGWDFGQVQASVDGVTWTSLSGKYTTSGSGNQGGVQPLDAPGYDGNQSTWVKEQVSLEPFVGGSPFYLRFNLKSDGYVTADGWFIDDISVIVYRDSVLSAIEPKPISANRFELFQNFPNPFNPTTQIRFGLAKAANVEIKIFDSLGKEVRTLINQSKPAGNHVLLWNGKNNEGRLVASGSYFYIMKSGDFKSGKKLLLLR